MPHSLDQKHASKLSETLRERTGGEDHARQYEKDHRKAVLSGLHQDDLRGCWLASRNTRGSPGSVQEIPKDCKSFCQRVRVG